MDERTRYRAIYLIPMDADEATANTIAALNDEATGPGPQTLGEVLDCCRDNECAASLRDEAGFLRGRVDKRGNYTLV